MFFVKQYVSLTLIRISNNNKSNNFGIHWKNGNKGFPQINFLNS